VNPQHQYHRAHPERYAATSALVDLGMRHNTKPCRGGECDDDGKCGRHRRFSAERYTALLARWVRLESRWTWYPLGEELPRWVLRQLELGACVRVREFAGGSAHWVRVEETGFGGVGFYRCSDGEAIGAIEVQVRR
jgi:hypothetical protein